MPKVINNQPTSDGYTNALTLQNVYGSKGGWIVNSGFVYVQQQISIDGQQGSETFGDEFPLPTGAHYLAPGTIGIRVRSYTSGIPVSISAAIFAPDEPGMALGAFGQATPSTAVAALNFQHNDVAVATENTLDFEDAANVITWSVVDDPANTRIKLTPAFAASVLFSSSATAGTAVQTGAATDTVGASIFSTGVVESIQSLNANTCFACATVGDTVFRLIISAVGSLNWGPGNGAIDTNLSRGGVGILNTGSNFRIQNNNGLTTVNTTNNFAHRHFLAVGDANPSFVIFAQGAMEWGAGGASALDIEWARIVNAPTGTGQFLEMINGSGLGYGTGCGGTGSVTQANAFTTGVTINQPSGQATVTTVSLATGTAFTLKILNSCVGTSDTVIVTVEGADAASLLIAPGISAAGTIVVGLRNETGSTITSNIVVNFAVIKGATA